MNRAAMQKHEVNMKVRSFTISLLILAVFSANLTSCGALPASPIQTLTPAREATATPVPTASATPAESQLPDEVNAKFEQAGIDIKDMTNAKFDKDGLHIALKSGEVIVSNDELIERIHIGQGNVLQYRDKANQNVIYAFDKETKTFLESSQYLQKDKNNVEGYIRVGSWDKLKELWEKEKMFLIPFDPENTYFPESEDINRDYLNFDRSDEYYYPFGKLPAGMDSPFRLINFVILEKDETAGRLTDTYIVSEQVYNPDDKSFSTLHFVFPTAENSAANLLKVLIDDDMFLLPLTKLITTKSELNKVLFDYYEENTLVDSDLAIIGTEELVYKWFDIRHVPEELEDIPFIYRGRYMK